MRQVDVFVVVIVDQLDGILEHGHHAESEQVDFDDAHVGATVLVPLHDRAVRHRRRLQRNHGIELALADHHAAGVLAQMPRQILQSHAQRKKLSDARMPHIESGLAEIDRQCIFRILIPPGADQLRQLLEHVEIEAQNLSDLARRRPSAIRDDIGRHRGAEFSVTLVDVLDHAFALVAAGQIEIDVRPLAAFFGKKAFEEQLHLHRIDGRDSQRVTDRAVGGRAAALHENVVRAAELDDVPDDQEIAFQFQFLDQPELAFDLLALFFAVRLEAPQRTGFGQLAQKRSHGFACRHRIGRELVSEIFQSELES